MRSKALLTAVIAGVAVAAALGWSGLAHAGSTPRQIEYATVEVVGFQQGRTGYDAVGWGSGALVDQTGLILTAFHVVGDPQTGRLLNPEGLAGIATVQAQGEAPVPAFLGTVVTYSPSLDLALVAISLRLDGSRLPAYTFFPTLALPGLRDRQPVPGDTLTAYGFGTGFQDPVTAVPGKVDHVAQVTGYGGMPLVVTATIPYGDGLAGGPVMDANGVLAGIALGMNGRSANAQAVVRPWEEARLWASGQVTGTQTPPSVTVAARIVDHATGRGIPNAVLLVLKPYVAIDDFINDPNERDVAAQGETDRNGSFVTAPPVASGIAYNMIVYADGYQPAYSAQPIMLDQHVCPSPPRCDFGTIQLDQIR